MCLSDDILWIVCFSDVMPIFHDATLVKDMCQLIADHVRNDLPVPIDAIVGIEARGK